MSPPSALTLVKLAVLFLGLFNTTLIIKRHPRPSITEPRQIHIKNEPQLQLLHLDLPSNMSPLTLITEESVHYPINGTLADLEWASLVPEGNRGLVLIGPDADARPYAISMFHTLHCLNRIRRAIVGSDQPPPNSEPGESSRQSEYHIHHCLNYVRQMILCAANTRLNAVNHVLPSGQQATDGIGMQYQCRDWHKVYEAYEANHALNRTMVFA